MGNSHAVISMQARSFQAGSFELNFFVISGRQKIVCIQVFVYLKHWWPLRTPFDGCVQGGTGRYF
jgi:hypothetical protein